MKAVLVMLVCLMTGLPGQLHAAEMQGCVSTKCHPDMGKGKYLHGPVAAGQCMVCHVKGPKDRPPKKHDLSMPKLGAELCYGCHEQLEKSLQGAERHGPIADGVCIDCHNPHQSENAFLLTAATMTDLCFSCHENNMTNQKYLHGPVAGGDCIVCHNPHGSKNDFLLTEKRTRLCLTCHEEIEKYFTKKYVHPPLRESCGDCHTPHGSAFAFHLREGRTALCGRCHTDFVQQLAGSNSKHSAISKNGCLGCHQPHASDHGKGLREAKTDLCLMCHETMEKKIAESRFLHGPVADGDCVACHDPHATDYAKHLTQFFPDEFYFAYKAENYSMCFGCHNKEIATEKETESLTDFRNGVRNLHFLHVNREKGRSCKACHEVHAGSQQKHIASEVPFGASTWMLPIKYTKTETGGGCVVGCHKEKEYDRISPVSYEGRIKIYDRR